MSPLKIEFRTSDGDYDVIEEKDGLRVIFGTPAGDVIAKTEVWQCYKPGFTRFLLDQLGLRDRKVSTPVLSTQFPGDSKGMAELPDESAIFYALHFNTKMFPFSPVREEPYPVRRDGKTTVVTVKASYIK